MKTKIIGLCFLLLGAVSLANGQTSAGVEANYILGFGTKNIALHNAQYSTNPASGYAICAFGAYSFAKAKTDVIFKAGFKQLFVSGEGSHLAFTGHTNKVVVALGGRYFFTPKWSTALFVELENNFDDENLRTQTSDLFRYQIVAQAEYNINKHVAAFAAYSGAFYPIQNQYIIYNPQHQICVGLAVNIFKQ